MPSSDLASFGWDLFFQQQLLLEESPGIVPARVMSVHRSGLQIAGAGIEIYVEFTARSDAARLTVGDWALYDAEKASVVRRLERKSLFKRRAPGTDRREQLIAANVDTLFIVSSCNQEFNEARLERYLAIAREAQVLAVIVLTKSDLAGEPGEFVRKAAMLAPGIVVEAVNALERESLACLDGWLESGQTIALLGSSGVGKSTLTNTLSGEEQVDTRAVRDSDDKGVHTTTARMLHRLPSGAWLLDTPGMRELQLLDVRSGIDDVFAEISALRDNCRFADCSHDAEPGCAVQQAVIEGRIDAARLNRWRKLVREEVLNKESIAERRARGRSLGQLYKSAISEKASQKRGRKD